MPKTKDDEKGTDDGAGADDAGGGGDDHGTGDAVTLEQVAKVAEDVATRVVEKLLGDDPTDDDGDGGKGDGATAATPNARTVESTVAAEVQRELGRIREHESVIERVAKVEEKLVEKPPEKVRAFTRAMWGGD